MKTLQLARHSLNLVFRDTTRRRVFSNVAPPPDTHHWANDEEPVEDYGPSGYHPIAVGDILGSQYRVLRKLGWGVYSTVWLVQHQNTGGYAALKLMTALASETSELHEVEYLQRMRDQCLNHPGHGHVIQLLDTVYHQGPNGNHLCLVTELLGESLASFTRRWKNDRPPVPVVKRIARQVILGLDYLHNVCNIIHTDIKPANVLFTLKHVKDSTLLPDSAQVLAQHGPRGRLISRLESRPISIPLPSDFNSANAWDNIQVKITDVGVACWADKVGEHFTDLIQSPALRAPEVCIGAGWGKPADIWSLGCMMYELVTGQSLIRRDIRPESVPSLHMLLFGDYPSNLVKRGKYSGFFFHEDGSLKIPLPQRLPLEEDIRRRVPEADVKEFTEFLTLMFQLDPSMRASLEEILNHQWLKCS